MPHPRSRSIPRRAQALDQVESRYAKSDARSRCMQVDYVARMGIPRETMPFSLVNRVFHQACHTRITDSTGLIVCRGLPKTQEKSSKTVPFSLKSYSKVTNVTFPRSRGKRRPSRNSMQDDGKAADSASGATPATAGYPLSISATAPSTASCSGFFEP